MKKIGKVQITSGFPEWWGESLSIIFTNPDEVKILSAIEYEGGLYLIYLYDAEDEENILKPCAIVDALK